MRRFSPVSIALMTLSSLGLGCGDTGPDGPATSFGVESLGDDTGADDGGDDSADRFDVLADTDGSIPCGEGGECPQCEEPEHTACDQGSTDPFAAMGLGCPGDPEMTLSSSGSPDAIGVRSSFGPTDAFAPTEGSAYAVIGSGVLSDLDSETPDDDAIGGHAGPTHCNDDLGAFDPGPTLPPPLRPSDVGGQDCAQDPNLVGKGDCSNTIQGQFDQGSSANDYTELRIVAQVPDLINSFTFDFAFFSTEYPYYFGSVFNDMFVGWLESEEWTGNVSFDDAGNPISLNAGFLDYRDDTGMLPEFAGTCMRYHAGTKWLSTTAGVVPGEQVTIVFAVFDLSDSILDSYVFLDNFHWGCDGTSKPSTKPQG